VTHNFRTEPQTKSEVANHFDEVWHGEWWEVHATQDAFPVFVGSAEEYLCGKLVPELFLELRLFVDLIAKPQMKAAVAKIERISVQLQGFQGLMWSRNTFSSSKR
jgi:hypothetical protein